MTARSVLSGVVTLILSAASAGAQGQAQKQVAVPPAVVKSMTANKPKAKIPLGAKVGIGRKANVAGVKPVQLQPTSVSEIGKKK